MNESIQQILANDKIPTPPSVASRLLEVIDQPDVEASEITKIIGADPKLSAKLIDYCNSPIVARPRPTSSLQQAVVILGMRSVKMLALSFSLIQKDEEASFDYDGFWNRSLALAITSRVLSKRFDGSADEDFLLGLVLNMGLIGIGNSFPKEFAELAANSDDPLNPPIEEQNKLFGFNHYEVGGKLLEKWRFPQTMYEFIGGFSDEANRRVPAGMIFTVAQNMVNLIFDEKLDDAKIEDTKTLASDLLGLPAEEFDELFDGVITEWKEYAILLSFKGNPVSSMQDIELKAREYMLQLSLNASTQLEQVSAEKDYLEEKALVDTLTELRNRRAYETEATEALDETRKNQQPFGLIVLDIDHFKSVNDTYGHAIGDEVLKNVGNCLKECTRGSDRVYRIGGEEFVVLLPGCNQDQASMVSERFRQAVERLVIKIDDERTLSVTASFGVSWSDCDSFQPLDEIFSSADKLLYEAKNSGRNRCKYNFEVATHDSSTVTPRIDMGAGIPSSNQTTS